MARVRPIARAYLYNPGQGDPYVIDRGLGWLDILLETGKTGTYSFGTLGVTRNKSHLELLPEIGLTCRPFVVPKSTLLSRYNNVGGGDWKEITPATGKQVTRLVQFDTQPEVSYNLTCRFALPANPHFAFTLGLPDTPADWPEDATWEPYVQLEFGMERNRYQFAIRFDKNSAVLLRNVANQYVPAEDIKMPTKGQGYSDSDEIMVFVRCLRGKIGISTDFGSTYTWHENPDKSYIRVASSKFSLNGRGGMCVFGLHQMMYYAGSYMSQPVDAGGRRFLPPVVSISGRYDSGHAGGVLFSDVSSPINGYARYMTTLTPKSIANGLFRFYEPPVLYSTTFRYGVQTQGGLATFTEPWENRIFDVSIDWPIQLSEGNASFQVYRLASEPLTGNYRNGKVSLALGWVHDDDSEELYNVFTGYISSVSPDWVEYGLTINTFELQNASIRFRERAWEPLDVIAIGGQTPNAAADFVLYSEGLGSTYRLWDSIGSSWLMPPGLPEEPTELLKPRESKWTTLERLHGYSQREIAVTSSGGFVSVPRDYTSGTTWVYNARVAAGKDGAIVQIGNPVNYQNSGTCVITTGKLVNGLKGMAWAVDFNAEQNPLSGRFTPWRKTTQTEVPDTSSMGMLLAQTADIASESFPIKYEPDVESYVNLELSRRDEMIVNGCESIGIPTGGQHVVLALNQKFTSNLRTGQVNLSTSVGLRRL